VARVATVATVVVPFRSGGKSRLPAGLRVDLALAMLGDVLEAAMTHAAAVRLVTGDATAAGVADGLGVEIVADPGDGQGGAVEAALIGAAGPCLVVNADLPCATPGALARLAELAPALVAAADGTTNALALPDRSWFTPAYGAGSAGRFGAAGLRPAPIPELEHDVDTLLDLERLTLPLGRRTTRVLNQHKGLAAQTA
jgi:2-phospho-L-lactate guanylyltransferase (CobY/MobA/RfbA family)